MAAKGNVVFVDKINNYIITSEIINYNKNEETINTTGDTKSEIYSRYSINSKDIIFLKNEKIINSNYKTTIIDNEYQTLYKLKKFNFILDDELLKGHDILVNLNYNHPLMINSISRVVYSILKTKVLLQKI